MYKLIKCSKCSHRFRQLLPDVTGAQADRLKAAADDRGVMFKCPQCKGKIWLKHWDLPDLPEPA